MSIESTAAFVGHVYRFHNHRLAPADCPFILWLLDQAGREDTANVWQEMVDNETWEEVFSMQAIVEAKDCHPLEELAAVQEVYARDIARGDWAKLRGKTERLVVGFARVIEPSALQILLDWIGANNPNAKFLFASPEVLAQIPPEIDLNALGSQDFPELADVDLRGTRGQ